MDPKPNTAPFGATQPPATSSAPVPTPPFNTNPPPMQPATVPQAQSLQSQSSTPTIITILLLIFLTPIGVIVMWLWPKWKIWVKVLVMILAVVPVIITGIFLSIVLVSINPTRQFQLANNTARQNYTSSIQGAVDQLKINNAGQFPPEVGSSLPVGVPVPLASSSGPGIVALCEYLTGVKGTDVYLSRLPIDPKVAEPYQKWKDCNDFDTGFVLIESGIPGSRITVEAPLMEKVAGDKSIEVSPEPQQ